MKRKVECLNRLFDLNRCRIEILEHLKAEKLINDDQMQGLLNDHHTTHATRIATMLEELVKKEQLQLVDYEWTILPKELIRLTIVSNTSKKEFVYSV